MEIRATAKDYKTFKKLTIPEYATLTKDERIPVSVVMVHNPAPAAPSLIEWTRGRKHIISFLRHGYVRIQKKCPYRLFGRCRAEKCSLYVIQNNTGDCAHIWAALKF